VTSGSLRERAGAWMGTHPQTAWALFLVGLVVGLMPFLVVWEWTRPFVVEHVWSVSVGGSLFVLAFSGWRSLTVEQADPALPNPSTWICMVAFCSLCMIAVSAVLQWLR
jgi:hypothetical protein